MSRAPSAGGSGSVVGSATGPRVPQTPAGSRPVRLAATVVHDTGARGSGGGGAAPSRGGGGRGGRGGDGDGDGGASGGDGGE